MTPSDPGSKSVLLSRDLTDRAETERRESRLAENKDAIEAYNEHVEKHGVFSDGLRSF